MALISCSECGKEVSDQAAACIHCGNPMKVAPVQVAIAQPASNPDDVCSRCKGRGVYTVMKVSMSKKVPVGAVIVAWIMMIVGVLSITAFIGLGFLLAGILVLVFGRRDHKNWECPECGYKL